MPVEVRADKDPSTKSARGGSICSDTCICLSSFSEKEVPLRENVQWHKCKEWVHYLSKKDKGGSRSRNEAHHKPGDQPQKKKARPRNIKIISDDTRREESIRRE